MRAPTANRPDLRNAIAKASRVKCRVAYLGRRSYLVVTPAGRKYTVRFEVREGLRFGWCNCRAAALERPCYHLAKAAAVDSAIQRMRGH